MIATGITTRLILVCVFLFVSSRIVLSKDSAHLDVRTTDEQEIYAVVIRSQMEQWIRSAETNRAEAKEKWQRVTAEKLNFGVFFVSINRKDPSDGFLRRLHDIPRKIEKLSSARYGELGAPFDKTTHQPGIIFSVEGVHWSNADGAELHGGYFCDGRCGARILFRVERKNGQWVVKSSEREAVL